MKKILLALGAVSLAVPAMAVIPASKAEASVTKPVAAYDSAPQRYKKKRHAYREWRGRDGRTYCRKSDGTTGLVIGAVGGALVGRTIDTHGDRSAGTLLGAVAGGLAGREIDRSGSRRRCR
ncbi:glycine zipper 2TM domain-containing protein [Sphingomonas sp. AOB5]|uniref:glycine zipper 2TM domain-containing protein n=1 Tax=Sphingomonas sp. AOB5 TaxID=3034017 RepID=UPI0023F88736|nr:glycine zipper 2TM domain-containing protein [Sphingomonas sp. AOB5]MDF7776928.1 glycine zipper 2TM domain-containing protein [Sphingomonas sp. AOB5]